MFRAFSAHHQEINDCCGNLWFYLRIVVTVVLCSWSGRLARPPESPSPYPQVPATCPCPEPTPSSPHDPPNFLKIHLNIILPFTSWSPQWHLSLRLPHQHPVHTSILPHTRHMLCPSHSIVIIIIIIINIIIIIIILNKEPG
jgi:hypothetical protein